MKNSEKIQEIRDILDKNPPTKLEVGTEPTQRFSVTLPKSLAEKLRSFYDEQGIESITEGLRMSLEKSLHIEELLQEGRVFVVPNDNGNIVELREIKFVRR